MKVDTQKQQLALQSQQAAAAAASMEALQRNLDTANQVAAEAVVREKNARTAAHQAELDLEAAQKAVSVLRTDLTVTRMSSIDTTSDTLAKQQIERLRVRPR
jgi:hypothetical protein